jgi:hypothetical protein
MQTNLYAHTEAHHPYPAFVSVNRQQDGRIVMTVRERGHNGERMASIDLSDELLDAMSLAFMDVRNVPDDWADRAGAAIQQALDRAKPNGWMCSKCGTDRTKAPCPKGHSAALTGECPMVGTAA